MTTIIKSGRQSIGLAYERRYLPKQPFSIISDDCWGGQVYRYHKLPYLTPTVGLQVMQADYIAFIKNLRKSDFLEFKEENLTSKYPTIRNPYALLLCVHYETAHTAIETFRRRYERIVWENIFYKIDFGAPWYSFTDVTTWNEMALPNSVALTYTGLNKRGRQAFSVHNEVRLDRWRRSGTRMYFASRRYFDLMEFLKTGVIVKPPWLNSLVYKMLTDPWWFREVRRRRDDTIPFATAMEAAFEKGEGNGPPPYAV